MCFNLPARRRWTVVRRACPQFVADLYGSFSVKWFFVCCRFLVWSGKAVPRPVACDQVRGARGRCQGTEMLEAFRVVAAHGDPDFVKYWQQGSIVPPEDSPLARVMHGAAIVHISDAIAEDTYRTAPALTRLVDLGGVRTCVIVPLRKDDVLLGVITAYRQEVHPFSDKQIALLQNFA